MQAHTTTRSPATSATQRDVVARAHPPTRRLLLAGAGIALVPLIVSAIAMVVRGHGIHPWGDQALLELDVRDVGRHFVLTGAYSRFGWRHPGPLEDYLLALPYRLVGERSVGIYLGALLINGAAIAGIVHVARRRAGAALVVWSTFVVVLLVRTFGPNAVRNPWTPYATVIPCLLMILLGWSLVEGDVWSLPLAVATGSFLVQSHVEYSALVGVLIGGGLVILAARALSEPGRRALRKLVNVTLLAVGIGVVLWIPPVVQQLTHNPGNLGLLVRFFRQQHPGHSMSTALHVIAGEWSWRPNWLVHWGAVHPTTGELDTASFPLPIVLAPYLAALVASWRRAPSARNLLLVVAVCWAVALVSVTHIVGPLYPYLLRWLDALGAATWLATGWALWLAFAAARERVGPVIVGTVVAGLAAVTLVASVASARAPIPYPHESRLLTRIEKPVVASVHHGNGVVVLRRDDTSYAAGILAGVALELERHHVPVRIDARNDPPLGALFTPSRLYSRGPVRAVVTVTAGGQAPPGSGMKVASWDVVSVLRAAG